MIRYIAPSKSMVLGQRKIRPERIPPKHPHIRRISLSPTSPLIQNQQPTAHSKQYPTQASSNRASSSSSPHPNVYSTQSQLATSHTSHPGPERLLKHRDNFLPSIPSHNHKVLSNKAELEWQASGSSKDGIDDHNTIMWPLVEWTKRAFMEHASGRPKVRDMDDDGMP